MRQVSVLAAFFVLAAGSVACGTSGSSAGVNNQTSAPTAPGPGAGVGGLPCDVDAVLAKRCRSCHGSQPAFGAPKSLVTYADLLAPAPSDPSKKMHEVVARRVADDSAPMPPAPNDRATPDEREVLRAWSAAGAPPSNDACNGASVGGGGTPIPTTCTPDLPLAPSVTYELPATAGDEYVCYGVDVTRAQPTHVVGFAPRVDNMKVVHHIVLFEADASFSASPQACNPSGSLRWRMVSAWAPGGKGFELPAEAGLPIQTNGATHYVVQVHYSNPQGLAGQRDRSGFSLCTAAPRQYEADVLAFGTESIDIPPNPPEGKFERNCSITVPDLVGSIHLVSAMPHMHKLGSSMSTTLSPAGGGAAVDLGTVPNFSFDSQAWLPIDATVHAGDEIRTRCVWTNPTGDRVRFGEATSDEMCFSFTAYYPRIASSVWSWALPAITAKCQ